MPVRPDLDTLERDAFDVVKIRAALPFLLSEARAAETLREALIRCAELAGADGEAVAAARSGAMKHPTVAEFAVAAVEELRRDYDDDLEGAKP